MLRTRSAALVAVLLATAPAFATTTIKIDAAANAHAIDPRIYGVNFASQADLKALNAPLNRMGGNNMTDYNWQADAQNLDNDYYFESYPDNSATPGAYADSFIKNSKNNGAEPLITIPLIGWVAKLGPGRAILPSFSVAKYGAQCDVDQYDTDAGDGIEPDCQTYITGNDPDDAYIADTPAREQKWLKHIISTWGTSAVGGVKYYLMDNEPSIWFDTHRDIHPVGPRATEYRDKVETESANVRSADPNALVMAPEEWGWEGYFYSGYDQQYAAAHNYSKFPDHQGVQKGLDYIPWLLKEWKKSHAIDILSVHFYPQGNADGSLQEDSDDDSHATQLLRNRSTRQLWDKTYTSESWIGAPVYLIPRMKSWISKYYVAGTPIAITEYNWGDEANINGATTQADVYGIFGREGLDMATRWTVPDDKSVTFKAMQIYRNYDGNDSGFGDTSVSASAPNPDNVSAFAALRSSSGAMTVMVINKELSANAAVKLKLANFAASGKAQAWQLTSANKITRLANVNWSGGVLSATEPAQSITLYVLPK